MQELIASLFPAQRRSEERGSSTSERPPAGQSAELSSRAVLRWLLLAIEPRRAQAILVRTPEALRAHGRVGSSVEGQCRGASTRITIRDKRVSSGRSTGGSRAATVTDASEPVAALGQAWAAQWAVGCFTLDANER